VVGLADGRVDLPPLFVGDIGYFIEPGPPLRVMFHRLDDQGASRASFAIDLSTSTPFAHGAANAAGTVLALWDAFDFDPAVRTRRMHRRIITP